MAADMGATAHAATVGRNRLANAGISGHGAPAATLTHSPSGSIAAVAIVAATTRRLRAGTTSGKTTIHTATGVHPRTSTAGATAVAWKSTAMRRPCATWRSEEHTSELQSP